MKTNESIKNREQMSGSINSNGNSITMDSLMNKVKDEDAKNLRISKSFQWIYILFAVLYTVMLFIPDSNITSNRKISGVFYLSSMLGFGLIFRHYYKEYKSIDYTLPVIEMLKSVANRYRLQTVKILVLLIPVLLMDAGITLSFYDDLFPMNPLYRVLIVQAIYIPAMTISMLIGVWIWSKKQKPLRDNALELIRELERD